MGEVLVWWLCGGCVYKCVSVLVCECVRMCASVWVCVSEVCGLVNISVLFSVSHALLASERVVRAISHSCPAIMAEYTGYTRTGECVAHDDDAGSHHVCIDMASNTGGNFCAVTGQSDWCSSEMVCDGDGARQCPVEHWCVCEWAFARYIQKAGGCDKIQKIVCEATNMKAMTHYEQKQSTSPHIKAALDCLKSRCLNGGQTGAKLEV